ncbi:MAG TPA: LLM class flavin-dependent oxidoreductase [Thermomicrobiales bacterium]|nr:LLM class flavin-dependent oxidoreductase [Thermomicrobiales bacterium]
MDGQVRLGVLCLGSRPAARIAEIAAYAECAGFSHFWIPDERFFREVYSLCAVAAAATSRIQVGPCVTDPFTRHPALTAMAIATLDEISGGRALLGLGAGISGFSELGIQHRRTARRASESIHLIRRLLTGEPVELHGDVLSFSGQLNFKPPRDQIPTYLAAGGPMMLRAGGMLADGVIIEGCVAPGTLERAYDVVDLGASYVGRDPKAIDIVARIDIAVDDSLDAAYDALRPRIARKFLHSGPGFVTFLARGLTVPDELRELAAKAGYGYTWDAATLARVGDALPRSFIDAFAIAATPEGLGERLHELVARGASQILVNPIPTHEDAVEPIIDAVAAWRSQS